MKKILLFFLFIPIFSCNGNFNKSKEITAIECPRVFFSSENSIYASGDNKTLNLDKINYIASFNNYGFVENCNSDQKYNNYPLDLLVLVEPMKPLNSNINLPIFVLLYDAEDKLINRQYFRIQNNLSFNDQLSNYEMTEINEKINIYSDNEKKVSSLIIGFVKLN